MELFTVLSVCWCIGIASGRPPVEWTKTYGESGRLRLFTIAEYVYFEPQDGSDTKSLLWKRSAPSQTRRGRHEGDYFLIEQLTQADSGIYSVKTKLLTALDTYDITVLPIRKTFNLTVDANLHFDLHMERKLFSIQYNNDFVTDESLLSWGTVTDRVFGDRLDMGGYGGSSLNVDISNLQVEDSGVFEIRDRNDNLAMLVHLIVTEPTSVWVTAGMSTAIVSLVVSCCCCLKRCCCKKSSKSTDGDSQEAVSPADPQPDVPQPNPPSYFAEPRRLGNPVDAYAYRPAAPASNFEMCHPAPVPVPAPVSPFPYPSVSPAPVTIGSAQAPDAAADQGPSASTNFLSSENEPRFQMKGMMGPPPLYSECVSADVYTSDKLNFGVL